MSFFEKLKGFILGTEFKEQCNDCVISSSCICFNCDSIDCKEGTLCKKIKPITYCDCKDCDGEKNCSRCRPDIH